MFSHYVFFENCVNPLPTTLLKETVQFILFGLFLVHPIFSSFGFWFFGILVTLVAWFSYCFFPSCSSRLAKCKQQLHNIFVFLQLHRQKWPKSKNEKWDERNIWRIFSLKIKTKYISFSSWSIGWNAYIHRTATKCHRIWRAGCYVYVFCHQLRRT